MHSGVLFGLTLLLGHLYVSDGVKCYQCMFTTKLADKLNSVAYCDEGSNFNGQNLTDHLQTVECGGQCYKIRAGGTTDRIINRGCYSSCVSANAVGQGTFCCATDYCNDTWRMEASLVAALASVLAAFLLRA